MFVFPTTVLFIYMLEMEYISESKSMKMDMRQINPQFEGHSVLFCIKYDLPYILRRNFAQ